MGHVVVRKILTSSEGVAPEPRLSLASSLIMVAIPARVVVFMFAPVFVAASVEPGPRVSSREGLGVLSGSE